MEPMPSAAASRSREGGVRGEGLGATVDGRRSTLDAMIARVSSSENTPRVDARGYRYPYHAFT